MVKKFLVIYDYVILTTTLIGCASNTSFSSDIKQYIQLSLNSNEEIVIATTYLIHDWTRKFLDDPKKY